MQSESSNETKPAYIKRIEKVNPEKQLLDVLTKNITPDNIPIENDMDDEIDSAKFCIGA